MIFSKSITIDSRGDFYCMNISPEVQSQITSTGVLNGIVVLFYQHTTGSLLIFEQEAGVMVDLEDTLDRLIPEDIEYKHHRRAVDYNGASHIRSTFFNSS